MFYLSQFSVYLYDNKKLLLTYDLENNILYKMRKIKSWKLNIGQRHPRHVV